ncbi:MAG: hypothetical protein C4523_08465 [Myxococcales bacterium]|nr:MAG: hypothetical protein C4523_08465 [Myxococcales bacterium]
MLVALVWLAAAGAASAAESARPTVLVEDLILGTRKMMMSFDVGEVLKIIEIAPDGQSMRVHLTIDVEVSAVVFRYRRHTDIHAWYDARGLRMFVSEIDDDGKITSLSGVRKTIVREREMVHVYGVVEGREVNQVVPVSYFHFTSLENYAYLTALTRVKGTWRVLDLFTGDIWIVHVTPTGMTPCPEPAEGQCYRVELKSPKNSGVFYYTLEGLLAGAEGEDSLGVFTMREREEDEQPIALPAEEGGGFLKGLFDGASLGPDAAPASEPALPPPAVAPEPETPPRTGVAP